MNIDYSARSISETRWLTNDEYFKTVLVGLSLLFELRSADVDSMVQLTQESIEDTIFLTAY